MKFVLVFVSILWAVHSASSQTDAPAPAPAPPPQRNTAPPSHPTGPAPGHGPEPNRNPGPDDHDHDHKHDHKHGDSSPAPAPPPTLPPTHAPPEQKPPSSSTTRPWRQGSGDWHQGSGEHHDSDTHHQGSGNWQHRGSGDWHQGSGDQNHGSSQHQHSGSGDWHRGSGDFVRQGSSGEWHEEHHSSGSSSITASSTSQNGGKTNTNVHSSSSTSDQNHGSTVTGGKTSSTNTNSGTGGQNHNQGSTGTSNTVKNVQGPAPRPVVPAPAPAPVPRPVPRAVFPAPAPAPAPRPIVFAPAPAPAPVVIPAMIFPNVLQLPRGSSSVVVNNNQPTPQPRMTQASVFSTRSWFMKPQQAAMKPGQVDAKTSNGQSAVLTADKTKIATNVNVAGRGDFGAKRDGNPEQIKLKSATGHDANVDQSQKANGIRTAQAGSYQGQLRQSKSGTDQLAAMSMNNGLRMDTAMHGQHQSFDANGSKGNKQNLTPTQQSKTGGSGTMTRNGEKYNYQDTMASNGDVNVQMSNIGTGPTRKTYTCQGQRQGVSNCIDQLTGLKVGEVISQPDGTVIVKKTIAKGVDVPIAKSKVSKSADGKTAMATVNDGVFQGQAGNYVERDCMADYGKKPGTQIQIQRPFTFSYNSQTTQDGKKTFTFPDCITFGGNITLPPGVDANRLAVQFDANILPAGKLKCVDPGACNKDCYYCNFCSNSRKVDMMANSYSPNLCNARGGGSYDIRVSACPPPEAFNKALCSGFTKSDPAYFKKKGDIQTRILFWLRPTNEANVKQDFNYKLKTDTTGLVRKGWVVSYAVDNKNILNANSPTDFDLEEWYIHKYGGSDQLIGCIEGLSNFTITGQKIKTDFLLEAGSLAAAPKSLFDTKTCPQVDAINRAQAQQDMDDASRKFTSKPGWNIFG